MKRYFFQFNTKSIQYWISVVKNSAAQKWVPSYGKRLFTISVWYDRLNYLLLFVNFATMTSLDLHSYWHVYRSDTIHSLFPIIQLFTATISHVIYTRANHSYSYYMFAKKNVPLRHLLPKNCYLMEQTPKICTMILGDRLLQWKSIHVSTVIYLTYSDNLHLFPLLFMLLTHWLIEAWILYWVNKNSFIWFKPDKIFGQNIIFVYLENHLNHYHAEISIFERN